MLVAAGGSLMLISMSLSVKTNWGINIGLVTG